MPILKCFDTVRVISFRKTQSLATIYQTVVFQIQIQNSIIAIHVHSDEHTKYAIWQAKHRKQQITQNITYDKPKYLMYDKGSVKTISLMGSKSDTRIRQI